MKTFVLSVLSLSFVTMGAAQNAASPPAPHARDKPIAAAYYFPNWHRQPDLAGEAFGEWPNVARATPRFGGHLQPKHPVWGIEDEADPNVMAKKIATATDHGLSAFIFCWYYHKQGPYLDRALNEGYLKAVNRSRLPFALMWANHDVYPDRKGVVTREVFDRMTDVLITRYFKDPAYWRVASRCYFSIYEPKTLVEGLGGAVPARATLDSLRDKVRRAGLGELHLNLIDWQVSQMPDAMQLVRDLGADSLTSYVWIHTIPLTTFPTHDYTKMRDDYFAYWEAHWAACGTPHFPNVTMGWDPTPRLQPGQPHTGKRYPDTPVLVGNTPEAFRDALAAARDRALRLPPGLRIITLYAWNEWTEGGYLEPDTVHGMKYLEAVRDVFSPRP